MSSWTPELTGRMTSQAWSSPSPPPDAHRWGLDLGAAMGSLHQTLLLACHWCVNAAVSCLAHTWNSGIACHTLLAHGAREPSGPSGALHAILWLCWVAWQPCRKNIRIQLEQHQVWNHCCLTRSFLEKDFKRPPDKMKGQWSESKEIVFSRYS